LPYNISIGDNISYVFVYSYKTPVVNSTVNTNTLRHKCLWWYRTRSQFCQSLQIKTTGRTLNCDIMIVGIPA